MVFELLLEFDVGGVAEVGCVLEGVGGDLFGELLGVVGEVVEDEFVEWGNGIGRGCRL